MAATTQATPATTRERIGTWVTSGPVQNVILTVIVFNALTLGLETTRWGQTGVVHQVLTVLDRIALAIFVVELLLKMVAFGWRFFTDPWNVFDFVVVGIALLPAAGPFQVLRGLRVLRVLRVIHVFPRLKFIVEALIRALPGIGAIAALMVIIFYVGAVMATQLFGQAFPEEFGSIWRSTFSLFTVMSLEGWPDLARQVMEVFPWAWAFFITFILFSSFTILNLFIAIIIDTMQSLHERAKSSDEAAELAKGLPESPATATGQDELMAELQRVRQELAQVREVLGAGKAAGENA